MPPPADPWSSPDRAPAPGPGPDPGRGRRVWPVVLGLVAALALTAVVATVVVRITRTGDGPGVASSPAVTLSTRPRPVTATTGVSSVEPSPTPASTPSGSPSGATSASPSPVSSRDVAPATTSPTAAPPEPLPSASRPAGAPSGPDRSLRTNTLYQLDLGRASVVCDLRVRRPKPPLADARLQPYLTQVLGCLTKVFTRPLAEEGFSLAEPSVKTYHRRIDSPCGDFGQDGSPAYYCSTTRTIYWPDTVDDGREAYTFARLGYVGLTAHEFGHHLQASTGMLNAYALAYDDASTKERYALSRRLELQAQCFEGVFLHVTSSDLGVSAKDRAELRSWHSYTGDEDPPDDRLPDHGSSRAQYAWLARGLDSGDLADCNTWTASAKSVT